MASRPATRSASSTHVRNTRSKTSGEKSGKKDSAKAPTSSQQTKKRKSLAQQDEAEESPSLSPTVPPPKRGRKTKNADTSVAPQASPVFSAEDIALLEQIKAGAIKLPSARATAKDAAAAKEAADAGTHLVCLPYTILALTPFL